MGSGAQAKWQTIASSPSPRPLQHSSSEGVKTHAWGLAMSVFYRQYFTESLHDFSEAKVVSPFSRKWKLGAGAIAAWAQELGAGVDGWRGNLIFPFGTPRGMEGALPPDSE